jgi:hypothetical protein
MVSELETPLLARDNPLCFHIQIVNPLWTETSAQMSEKLVPNFAHRGWHVVNVTDPYGRFLGFLDRGSCFLFQVATRLYSWG